MSANLHRLDSARRCCDRVVGLRCGRVMFDGTPDQRTTGVARAISGADASFTESATATAISAAISAADRSYADAMLA